MGHNVGVEDVVVVMLELFDRKLGKTAFQNYFNTTSSRYSSVVCDFQKIVFAIYFVTLSKKAEALN